MKRCYEGLFLFDNSTTRDWAAMTDEVRRLCDRIGADLQVCVKYDERRLAFEINGRKRGTYVLTYFDAEPAAIADLERDARLSDLILRAMVLRATKADMAKLDELKAWPAEQPRFPASPEGGRRGEDGHGGREWRGGRGPRDRHRDESPGRGGDQREESESATAVAEGEESEQ